MRMCMHGQCLPLDFLEGMWQGAKHGRFMRSSRAPALVMLCVLFALLRCAVLVTFAGLGAAVMAEVCRKHVW